MKKLTSDQYQNLCASFAGIAVLSFIGMCYGAALEDKRIALPSLIIFALSFFPLAIIAHSQYTISKMDFDEVRRFFIFWGLDLDHQHHLGLNFVCFEKMIAEAERTFNKDFAEFVRSVMDNSETSSSWSFRPDNREHWLHPFKADKEEHELPNDWNKLERCWVRWNERNER